MLEYPHMQAVLPILPWVQIVLAVLLIGAILLQKSEASLGAAFGGGASGPSFQKRGVERSLFLATIALAILFALSVLLPELMPAV